MVNIIFEAHGTTFDNENHKASGWNDVDLLELGLKRRESLARDTKMIILMQFFAPIYFVHTKLQK